MMPGHGSKHPTFRRSFLFAIQGFRTAIQTERNIKVMLCGAVFAVTMGLALRINPIE